MTTHNIMAALQPWRRAAIRPLVALLLLISLVATSAAVEVPGFTVPFRHIDAAAAAAGVILSIDVREGESVRRGQVLASLNQDVLRATLDIAAQLREARGELQSAQAELELKSDRLEKLRILLKKDHASEEEVKRADAEKQIAAARVLSAEEALQVRELELRRAKAQLDERLIRSPIDGVVTEIAKDVGEFVSPTDPVILTIVRLDPLLAVFSVPTNAARDLNYGDPVSLRIASSSDPIQGTVEYISPVITAQSNTITVKVRVENSQGRHRSGEKCTLLLGRPRG